MEVTRYTTELALCASLALMIGMMIAFRLGRHAGIRHRLLDPEGARSVSGAVEASIFALLGLLIAFTFSGAGDRFEVRRMLITSEANSIGTAWLRLDLLSEADRAPLRDAFRQYLDARLSYYAELPDETAAEPYLRQADRIEADIWRQAVEAAPRGAPGTVQMLIPAINEMFDVATLRRMALQTHPPLPIYGLLMLLALVCASLAGHHAAPAARHPWVLPLLFSGISALAIFVIMDLEYPRAGLIRIDSADFLLRETRARM
jgi:hypothetical protein